MSSRDRQFGPGKSSIRRERATMAKNAARRLRLTGVGPPPDRRAGAKGADHILSIAFAHSRHHDSDFGLGRVGQFNQRQADFRRHQAEKAQRIFEWHRATVQRTIGRSSSLFSRSLLLLRKLHGLRYTQCVRGRIGIRLGSQRRFIKPS